MKRVLVIFTVALAAAILGCQNPRGATAEVNYRAEMITLLEDIGSYAKQKQRGFLVIGNNSLGLAEVGTAGDKAARRVVDSLDGFLVESYFYGWDLKDDEPTPPEARRELETALNFVLSQGRPVFNIDYCSAPDKVDRSHLLNRQRGLISFLADSRTLDRLPAYPLPVPGANIRDIRDLRQVGNFVVLLNPKNFANKRLYLDALGATDYDLVIVDLYWHDSPLTPADVKALQRKKNGARRLVVAYMSVGEAEDYRPYWQPVWTKTPPRWLEEGNPDWPGSYKVKYWAKEWKKLLRGSPDAYLDKIIAAGFDGVFLDVVDAYCYFEEKRGNRAENK